MHYAAITSLVLVAGVAAAAFAAQDPGVTPEPQAGVPARLAGIDTDHDGRWSKAEWLAAGRKERGFDMMDTNHDGYLTIDELKAGLARFRARRSGGAAPPAE